MAGYIGNRAGGLATVAERKTVFTATSGQTTFTVSSGYTPNNVHVFQNGVRLVDGTDYTATNGSTIVLTTGASTDDQIVVIASASYQNADSYTKAESDGVRTFNRTTSDGSIVTLQKDGTTVGSIGCSTGNLVVGQGDCGLRYSGGADNLLPWNPSTNTLRGGAIDLGNSGGGDFKNLYLSGGVYLGGTTSVNYLDDYEEGTWTPILDLGTGITYSYQSGKYTKIGNLVHCEGTIGVSAMSADASGVHITLPFAAPSAHQAVSGALGHDTSLLGSKATNNVGFGVFGNNMFMFETGSNANYIIYNEITANVPGTIVFSLTYRLA